MGTRGPVYPWGLIIIFVVGWALVSYLHKNNTTAHVPANSPIPWQTDFESARQAAATQGRPLFVDFSATWCGPCQMMAQTTWTDASVAKALNGYVPVSVDIDAEGDLANKYGISAVPTLLVVDPGTGKVVKQITGALDPESFKDWLSSPVGG
jgi:thiol:disulfide interchange protein